MSFGIAIDEAYVGLAADAARNCDREEKRKLAWRDYEQKYSAWIYSLEQDAANGNESAKAELVNLRKLSKGKRGDENLLTPLKYDGPAKRKIYDEDEDEFGDPADLALDLTDPRESIVDFESVGRSELRELCDHFGAALVWATKSKNGDKPDLMQMGVRWLAIFQIMRPQIIGEMNLRIPASMKLDLLGVLNGRDPLDTGRFFRKPLAWVRKCSSLLQLGKRGYSAIYNLRGDLINSATCAAIGALDGASDDHPNKWGSYVWRGSSGKTRQAANKPIQEFRDTFGGIKSLPMRGKKTRQRCKKAQEKN